jgi:hypothetical protein
MHVKRITNRLVVKEMIMEFPKNRLCGGICQEVSPGVTPRVSAWPWAATSDEPPKRLTA